MNNTMKIVISSLLLVMLFYSSMILYIYNSTCIVVNDSNVCGPILETEWKMYYICRTVFILASSALTLIYISDEVINNKTKTDERED